MSSNFAFADNINYEHKDQTYRCKSKNFQFTKTMQNIDTKTAGFILKIKAVCTSKRSLLIYDY